MVEPSALVGQVIDNRWQLVAHVGSGQFGEVYAAEPRHLDLANGAIKILHPSTRRERQLIMREITVLSELQHEGLLGYRDAGEIHDGVLAGAIYIVTELCDGALNEEPGWGTGGAEFEDKLTHAIAEIAEALGYPHGEGLIHRDVKPANILRQAENWKLSDFGLVRDHTRPSPAARTAQGTGPYLAPETIRSSGAGPPADMYALGVVIHEALTGSWPYDITGRMWSMPPLTEGASIELSPLLPDHWRASVESCLQGDPRRRPTADEFVRLLPSASTASLGSAGPPPMANRTVSADTLPPRRFSKRWWLISSALVVAFIAIASAVVALAGGDGDVVPSSTQPEPSPTATTGTPPDAPDPPTTVMAEPQTTETTTTDGPATSGEMVIDRDTTLVQDHNGNINITADNVTLDCAGHTITGHGTDNTTGPGFDEGPKEVGGRGINIESSHPRPLRTGITVANCDVTNFPAGMLIARATDIVLRNNSANGNAMGFWIEDATVALTDNTANDNLVLGFIVTQGSAGTKLVGNTANDNRSIGFALDSGASGVEVTANHASGNGTDFADTITGGTGTGGTDNTYTDNTCGGGSQSGPPGAC